MAGSISNTIGAQAGIVAQTQQAAHVKPVPTDAAKTIAQNANVFGQAAAVVSLGNRKGRGVSHGDAKAVDATYEKQEASAAKKEKENAVQEGEKGPTKATVNVEA